MGAFTQELKDKRAKLLADMQANFGGKELNAEQRTAFDKAKADFSDLGEQIQRAQFLDEQAAANSGTDKRETTTNDKPETKGKETYAHRFTNFLRACRAGQPMPAFESRSSYSGDPQSLTAGDGGYLAPDEYDRDITRKALPLSVLRQICTIKRTASGKYRKPIRTTAYPTAVATAEKDSFAQVKLAFDILEIEPHKMTLEVPITDEILNDSLFDIQDEVTGAIADGFGVLGEAWYATGTGTTIPDGIVPGSALGKTAASQTAITMDELKELKHSVVPAHRNKPGAGYLMNDNTFLAIALLKDGMQRNLLQVDPKAEDEYRLHGKPVYISTAIADIAHSAKPVLFGDFKRYIIVDRQTTLMVDPYSQSSFGIILVKGFVRTGGKIELSEAIKHLVMA